jgi:hypothetical protein
VAAGLSRSGRAAVLATTKSAYRWATAVSEFTPG